MQMTPIILINKKCMLPLFQLVQWNTQRGNALLYKYIHVYALFDVKFQTMCGNYKLEEKSCYDSKLQFQISY